MLLNELILADGIRIRYELCRSARAKYLRLTLKNAELLRVTIPASMPEQAGNDAALELLQKHQSWILKHILLMRSRNSEAPLREHDHAGERSEERMPEQILLEYLDPEPLPIFHQKMDVPWLSIRFEPDEKRILMRGKENPSQEHIRQTFREFLLQQANCSFLNPFLALSGRLSLFPGRLSFRIQKSRWGSCSGKSGNISLNALLLFFPERYAEHVIIHELCHLRELNHSERFWREVEKFCPEHKRLRQELSERAEKIFPSYFVAFR